MKLTVIVHIFGDVMVFVDKHLLIMVMLKDQWIENLNQQIHGGNNIKGIVEDSLLKLVSHKTNLKILKVNN